MVTDPRQLTPEQLKAIAERTKNATEAPWSQIESPWGDGKAVTQGRGDPHGHLLICRTDENEWQEDIHHGDDNWFNAAFIAAARSDVPALLAHIAWQAERLADAERASQATYDQAAEQYQRANQAEEKLATAQATIEKQRSRLGDLWGTLNEHQWGCRCEGNELCPACGFSIRTREGRHAKSCDIARALATPEQETAGER